MNNSGDVFKIIGASNHCADEREKTDFYSTDPECVNDLLEVETFNNPILEPCCGNGNISKALIDKGYKVVSSDLYDHGFGDRGVDVFSYHELDMDVVTNPPYGIASEITEHLLKEIKPGHKIAMFLKLTFLEGQDRFERIFSQKHLKAVYVYSKRVACYKNDERYQKDKEGNIKLDRDGNKVKIGSAVCYAWFIFEKNYIGDPVIKWISKINKKEPEISTISLF